MGSTADRRLLNRREGALRPKVCKLACHPFLSRAVSRKLRRKWSPEQIAGWLKRAFLKEPHKQVSHETIYRSLYIQARGVLKKELLEHLRAKRTIRRSKHASLKRNGLGQIKNAVSISERPASVEDRAVPGHWALGDCFAFPCCLTGGRLDWWFQEQLHCNTCRTKIPLCHASQSDKQRYAECNLSAYQTVKTVTQRAL